jgi:CheY-like chemotaxis protein
MPNNSGATAKVLFVDDDGGFLQLVEQAFGHFGQGNWEIHLATDAARALAILKQHPVHLAVLDINMPEVSGLDLLKVLNRDYPALQKVFLTGLTDEQTRICGLEGGAELFLEKPANLAGLQSVFATLNELVRWQQKQGTRGNLRPARLLDIIKMECSSGNSRVFEVFGETARGQIFVKDGGIIHAVADGRRGQSAFTHLASQLNAEFNLKQFVEPPERSIDRQWEFLVMEAFRTQEQLLEAAAEAKAKAAPAPASTPPARESSESGAASPGVVPRPAEPALPLRPSFAPLTPRPASQPASATPPAPTPPKTADKDAPLSPAPPIATRPPAPAVAPVRPAARPKTPPAKPQTDSPAESVESEPIEPAVLKPTPVGLKLSGLGQQPAFRIEEMLLCSKQREVLYEWHCIQTDSRVRLIEYLAQKFYHSNPGLPLGKFDRLEAQARDGRIVIHFQGDDGLFIRSNTAGHPWTEPAPKSNLPAAEWLKRGADVSGVLACGVVRPEMVSTAMVFAANISLERLNQFWVQIAETFEVTNERGSEFWQLRLIYELGQCYCVRRADRFVFGVLLSKESDMLDIEAAQRLLGHADQFRGV